MMNDRQMNGAQVQALARLVCTVRPEWDQAGVIAHLVKLCQPLSVSTARALAAALNPEAKTPAAIGWTPAPTSADTAPAAPVMFCEHCGRGEAQCWRAQQNTGLDLHPFRPAGRVLDPVQAQHLGIQEPLPEGANDGS